MKGRYFKKTTLGPTTRRIGVLGIVLITVLILAFVGLRGRSSNSVAHNSTVAKSPSMSTMAGGNNHYGKLDEMAAGQDAAASRDATARGQSYTASFSGQAPAAELGFKTASPQGGQLPIATSPDPKTTAAAPANSVANPFGQGASAPPPPPATARDADHGPSPSPHGQMPEEAAIELLQAWTPQAPQVERIAAASDAGAERGSSSLASHTDPQSASGVARSATDGSTLAAKSAKTLLLEAGHGVFARNVLAVSSDSNGPVIVEIESGPFVGARMTGSFERKEDRLVVKFQSLAIGEAEPIAVDAIAVAPDTMETAVASHVDEHYLTRVVLPTAAAFVQGLGQALAQSNSTSVLSPLGGTTSTTKLNLGQELGVAAGTAGQQVGQILQKSAPSGPTVTLDKDVSLGVVFLKPVYASD